MINVSVLRDKQKGILAFKCEGHAEYAKHPGDKDIVCAAVSAIIYSALGYMEEYFKMNDFTERDGLIEWKRPPKGVGQDLLISINPVLDAMTVGLKQIAAQYPKNIKILDEEV